MACQCAGQNPHRIFIVRVPRGKPGTLETARLIGELIAEGAKDFRVRQKAIEIFRRCGVPAKDKWGEIQALFEWVRQNIRYRSEENTSELQSPYEISYAV